MAPPAPTSKREQQLELCPVLGTIQCFTPGALHDVGVWAEHSPFELKDQLKARGYRWNADATLAPRSWYIDVDEANHQAEIAFLAKEIYQREISPLTRKITAYDRFSDRV